MLSNYLKQAIEDIDRLIQITKEDIKDIKLAKHEQMFDRTKEKNDLIISFGAKKALLDNELVLLVNSNPNKDLSELISDTDSYELESMKDSLQELHALNKEYAKFVVVVSEFYNSMVDSMFPGEIDGYNKTTSKPATFLKVRV